MECNNVLDANVMVNTCSITETKGWKRSIRVCLEQHIRNTVLNIMFEAYQTVDGRKRKTVKYDGKVRPSGVVDVVRVWGGGREKMGEHRGGEQERGGEKKGEW